MQESENEKKKMFLILYLTKKYWDEFRIFILQNRIVELGIGFVVGRAFNFLVKSFVNDLLVGPIGLFLIGDGLKNRFIVLRPGPAALLSKEKYKHLEQALSDGAITMNYGRFIQNCINFVFVGCSVFGFYRLWKFLFRGDQQSGKQQQPLLFPMNECKLCSECLSEIPSKARKCRYCQSLQI